MRVTISAKKIFWTLFLINVLFMVFHLILVYLNTNFDLSSWMVQVVDRFNMDAEVSVPTWFAQTLLLSCSALAGLMCVARKKVIKDARAWCAISLILLYVSIDEGSALHELIAEPVRDTLEITSGPFVFAWTIPVLIIVAILGLAFLKFFLRLKRRTRNLLVLSAVIFVGSAAGFEIISGAYWTSQGFAFDATYSVLVGLEEGFENIGTIVCVYALLDALGAPNKKETPQLAFID